MTKRKMDPEDPEVVKPDLNVWPGEEADAGSRLAGVVVDYDPTGGQGEQGFLDILTQDGVEHRWYLNSPGRSSLKFALRKVGERLDHIDMIDVRIVVQFDGWETGKQSGRKYRDYSVGVAPFVNATQREQEGA